MSESITKAAIDYIVKRRHKLDLKHQRNNCRCDEESSGEHITPAEPPCKSSCWRYTQNHFAFIAASRIATTALTKLERRVNKHNAESAPSTPATDTPPVAVPW